MKSVKVVHRDGQTEIVDLSKNTLITEAPITSRLQFGDTVYVPETKHKVLILGSVTKPGQYIIPENRQVTLLEVLSLAEGFNDRSKRSRIGIIEVKDGVAKTRICNVATFLANGDRVNNPTIEPGSVIFVPETDRIDINTILNGITSFALLRNATK
jgi:protein involved in polysaccharide export with SLBB domain